MSGSIFNKLHDLLTNQKAKREFRAESDHVYDSLFEGPEDPWYTDVYYAIYRFFKYGNWYPSDLYRRAKWFIQRGRRGYSDRDLWSFSTRLNVMLPEVLRYLREHKHGTPIEFCIDQDIFSSNYGNEIEDEAGGVPRHERWNKVLDKMIAGFEAGVRCEDMPGSYERELGEHPFRRPKNVSREDWVQFRETYTKSMMVLMKRDEELF